MNSTSPDRSNPKEEDYNQKEALFQAVESTAMDLEWSPEALQKLSNVPFFARGQAKSRSEELARQQWQSLVTVAVLEQAREEFGQ